MLITIVSFISILVVLILAHELGHFLAAKASGVRVEEFALGFPPRLLSVRRGETLYSLNAIPLGGFTKMAGEEDPKVPRSLASKSIGARLLVLGAGSLMNAILPILLLSVAFAVPHDLVIGQVLVKEVAPDSPAAIAGIQAGDVFLRIDGRAVHNIGDMQRHIQLNLGRKVTILVKRPDSITKSIQLAPRWRPPEGQGAIGIVVSTSYYTIVRQSYPFWKAIPIGVRECMETFVLFKNGIITMIIGTTPVMLAGPVGIAQITGEVVRTGISPLLQFAAFLSVNLAIFNILPLPALDGGRIAFVLLEWLRRGKRVSPITEAIVHRIGFALLMTLVLVITYQDIIRVASGELMP